MLKCPFCRSEDMSTAIYRLSGSWWAQCECKECQACGPLIESEHKEVALDKAKSAIKRMQHRKSETNKDDDFIICPETGEVFEQ